MKPYCHDTSRLSNDLDREDGGQGGSRLWRPPELVDPRESCKLLVWDSLAVAGSTGPLPYIDRHKRDRPHNACGGPRPRLRATGVSNVTAHDS